jgi:DNA-binding transcriptional LysR family regulator
LTDNGAKLLDRAQRILSEVDEAEAAWRMDASNHRAFYA